MATLNQLRLRRTLALAAALLLAGLAVAFWWRAEQRAALVRAGVPTMPETAEWPAAFRERLNALDAKAASGSSDALSELSQLYHANGFFAEAQSCYRALQRLEPREPRWPHRHAAILAGFGDLDAAIHEARRAATLAPHYVPAQLRFAEILFKRNELSHAAAVYQQILRKDDHPHATLGLARIDVENRRWADARARLERVVAQTNYTLGYDVIVTVYEHLGLPDLAAQVRGRAKASGAYREPADPWLDELMGHCYDPYRLSLVAGSAERSGDTATALRFLERAVALAPDEVSARFQLARTLQQARELKRARAEFERCTQMAPTFADGWAHLAALLADAGERAAAENVVGTGLSYCPDSPGLHLMRARFNRQAGRVAAAVEAYRRSLQLKPNEAEPYVELATLLLQRDAVTEALQHLHRAVEVEPDHPTALALLTLTAISQRDEAAARRWLSRVHAQPRMADAQARQLHAAFRGQFGREFTP